MTPASPVPPVSSRTPSMTPPPTDTQFDFAGKYTRPSLPARLLLEGFFVAVEELVGMAAPSSVVEVGCGEGFSTRRYRLALPETTSFRACDIEERLVSAARRR